MPVSPPPLPRFGAAFGRVLLGSGLLVLSFAGYQLWGTGLAEAAAQEDLANQLASRLERIDTPADAALVGPPPEPVSAPPAAPPGPSPAPPLAAPPSTETTDETATSVAVELGQPFANLRIPTIDLDKTVVAGTTREALRTGPGHYLGSALPGQAGNVAIAGHRTTYGAPFRDIDLLAPGDPIVVETADGVFTYRVEGQPTGDGIESGHRIVAPEEVHVIADQGDHRLTLTACHPRYSARQRIIVTAVLADPPPTPPPADVASQTTAPDTAATSATDPSSRPTPDLRSASVRVDLPPTPTVTMPEPTSGPGAVAGPTLGRDDGLGWQPSHAPATALWAALVALVAAAARLFGRLWRPVPAYLMATPTGVLCLVTCFSHLDRLIPAS